MGTSTSDPFIQGSPLKHSSTLVAIRSQRPLNVCHRHASTARQVLKHNVIVGDAKDNAVEEKKTTPWKQKMMSSFSFCYFYSLEAGAFLNPFHFYAHLHTYI
jgi:hypothetical protein